ncbi:hypothetical protein M3Y97_01169600 [Aphelenchoides bicaudatus]|nr:hypothetical protein M3Y97_01169600 [Aphelenchoides bicaudatus]
MMKMNLLLLFTVVLSLQVNCLLADSSPGKAALTNGANLQTKKISCKNLIARFNGTFQNKAFPNNVLSVDFQVHLNPKDDEKRNYFRIEYWNNDIVKMSDIDFWARDDQHGYAQCNPVNSTDCYLPYVTQNSRFFLDIVYYSNNAYQNQFHFSYFPTYNNSFTFKAYEKCTHNVPSLPNNYGPNTKLFKARMCCDD